MSALLTDYPLKATKDARSAMAEGLARELATLKATLPRSGTPTKFAAIYDTWATFMQRAMSAGGKLPAATVLPDRPLYDASSLTPRALEETWSGGDPDTLDHYGNQMYPIGDGSGDGYVLYTIAELVVPFVVVFRTVTRSQRQAFVKRIEENFVEDGGIKPDPASLPKIPVPDADRAPVRYGRLVELPSYYNRKARFTLQAQQLLDTESSAGENRWLAQFEFQGHVQVCVLRRGRAMRTRVQTVVDGTTENRAQ